MADPQAALATQLRNIEAKTGKTFAELRGLIADSGLAVYREILEQHNWAFPAEPDELVVAKLATIPPRDMKKLLLDAFGTARLAGRDHLAPEDIDSRKLCGRRARLGF